MPTEDEARRERPDDAVTRVLEPLVQSDAFFWLAKNGFYWFARAFYGLTLDGVEHMPKEGGLVVASNHMSSWDPPMLGSSVPREINYMAKKELFENRWLRLLMLGLRAFPVDRRSTDIGAIKEAMRRLRKGVAIGIFAQGTRNQGDAEAFDGAAFLAQRAGVPLMPAAVWREGRIFHVRYGAPLHPKGKSRAEIKATTAEMMRRVNALLPSGMRPFEPTEAASDDL